MATPKKPTSQHKDASSYDVGLHANAKVGKVDVGVSVDQQDSTRPIVGLSVFAPVVGHLTLGLLLVAPALAQDIRWDSRFTLLLQSS